MAVRRHGLAVHLLLEAGTLRQAVGITVRVVGIPMVLEDSERRAVRAQGRTDASAVPTPIAIIRTCA